jgi:hypothetical protein
VRTKPLPPPRPPANSFDKDAAGRGHQVFDGKAKCSMWHVPPLFPESGWNAHKPEEIGIDDFQSSRSPNMQYRTTPQSELDSMAMQKVHGAQRLAVTRAEC